MNKKENEEIRKKTSFTLLPTIAQKLIATGKHNRRSQSSMLEIIIEEYFEKQPAEVKELYAKMFPTEKKK